MGQLAAPWPPRRRITSARAHLRRRRRLADHHLGWGFAVAVTLSFAGYSRSRTLVIVLLLVAVGIAAGIALLLSRLVSRGVNEVGRAAKAIAGGDVDQHITVNSRDELGDMARDFGSMIDYVKSMAAAAEQIAERDLSAEIQPKSERDVLGNALAKMIGNLRGVIGAVRDAAGNVSSSSQQMASNSVETGRAVNEIASALGDVAQGAERQVRMVESTRGAVQTAAQAAGESADTGIAGDAQRAETDIAEVVAVAEQSSAAAEQVSACTQQTSASAQEISASAQQLAGTAEELERLVGRFRIGA